MATELAKAYVQIVPSAEGISGSIENIISPEASSAGDKAGGLLGGNLVGAIKGAIAAAGIGTILKETLGQGAALQQSIGGIETLYKESADKMKQYADEAYRTAGLSANEYMEQTTSFAAALVSSLGGDTEAAAEAANMAIIDMADNSNKMGTSMESIQNAYQGFAKGNYTMLDNLKLGYGGTREEMSRLLADAEKFSGVKYDINNLSDVYSAIHVIQTELDITGTTAAEASTTFSGSFAAMQAAATNLLGNLALGNDIMPSLQALGDTVSTFLVNNLIPMVVNIVTALPTLLVGAAEAMGQVALDLVTGLTSGLDGGLPEILAKGNEMIVNLVTGVLQQLPSVISSAGTIITGFVGYVMQNMPEIMQKGFEMITNLAQGVLNNVPAIISAITSVIANLLATIVSNLPDILAKGIEIIANICTGIINSIPDAIAAITQIVTNIIDTFKATDWAELGLDLITKVAEAIIGAVQKIKDAITNICTRAKEAFFEVDWLSVGSDIIGGVVDGVKSAASSLFSAVKGVVKRALGAAEDEAEIGSPSRLFAREVGQWIPKGIAAGVLDNVDSVESAMQTMTRSSVNDVEAAMRRTSASAMTAPASMSGLEARVDYLTSMLARYLPECAQPSVIDTDSLARTMNRKLGVAYL